MKYLWDDEFNLFRCSDPGDFTYSDGAEVEAHLLSIVSAARDRSTFSPELVRAITDWPTEYHLSRARHCLVRPLEIPAGASVLELGCGCGAVTRYLGEIGANVVAVEGSLARARVAAQRCRGLENVRVVVDDLLRFETEQRFDYVLLIGVLEYAAVFSSSDHPFEHYLRSVARFLTPEGRVVVAIENKLGLKYFNGCGEDHVGTPFFGIQNLYGPKTVRTFGRRELIEQLTAAGLAHTYFFYPFPDYKLPSVILTQEGIIRRGFEAVDLLARSHARDYTGSPYRSFDDALAFFALADNALLEDLSNSFLVVATAEAASNKDKDELARTFSIHRAPEFSTQTKIIGCDGSIKVVKEPLTSAKANPVCLPGGLTVTHRIGTSTYHSGRQLLWKLLEARTRSSDLEAIAQALRPWMEFLLQRARVRSTEADSASKTPTPLASYELPGELLDCTPFNLLENGGQLTAIDLEWQCDRPVSLSWVVTRGVLWSVGTGKASAGPAHKITSVIDALCSSFGLAVSESEIRRWFDLEAIFQTAVADVPCAGLASDRTAAGFLTFADEIANLKQQIVEYHRQLSSWQEMSARRAANYEHAKFEVGRLRAETGGVRRQTDQLHKQLSAAEKQLENVCASKSWRLTAPLRSLKKLTWDRYRARRQKRSDYRLLAESELFDAGWYLSHYPDVQAGTVDPLLHYLQHGAQEGRDPSGGFVTLWYLKQNPDVAESGINPLIHYLRFGAAEGRRAKPSDD